MRILNVLKLFTKLGHEQRSSVIAKYDGDTFVLEWSNKMGQPIQLRFNPEQTLQLREVINARDNICNGNN